MTRRDQGRSHPLMRVRNLWRVVWGPLIVALYGFGKLIPRDPRLWVFGNRKAFGDNPRYLMEYMRVHYPKVRLVWLARNKESRDAARRRGFDSFLVTSPVGIVTAFRAGVGVIGDGLGDINRAAIGAMILVHLFHGTPLKQLRLDAPMTWSIGEGWIGRLSSRFSRWMIQVASGTIDLITASSPISAQCLASAFGLTGDKVRVTGSPRGDIILGADENGTLSQIGCREKLDVPENSKIVLYAPTWREYTLPGGLWNGFDVEKWQSELARQEAYFLVKLHPHTPRNPGLQRLEAQPRIIVLDRGVCRDINILLRDVDVLVSDYSSVVCDFALLERPIVFFAPDHRKYAAARGFYEPYREITLGTHLEDWDDVLMAVERSLSEAANTEYGRIHRHLNDRYNSFRDTGSRQRIVEAVRDLLGKPPGDD